MAHRRTTRIVGIREFRQNLSKFIAEARKYNVQFVVLRYGDIAVHVTAPEAGGNIMEIEDGVPLPPPKSPAERRRVLEEMRSLRIQFPGHDGVAYQRRQRS